MAELAAGQVLALSVLGEGRPMTSIELARAMADIGMHLDCDDVAAILQSLDAAGLARRTPAVQLGKYRITSPGRAWLSARTSSEQSCT